MLLLGSRILPEGTWQIKLPVARRCCLEKMQANCQYVEHDRVAWLSFVISHAMCMFPECK